MRALRAAGSALAFVAVVGALLLVPAGLLSGGAWTWPRGLIYLAVLAVMSVTGQVALAAFRPASFEVRRQPWVADRTKSQPLVDAIGLVAYGLFLAAWVVFIPADVFSLRLLPAPPAAVSALGLAMALAGYGVAQLAIWNNPFAAPTIHDQVDQQVIDTGVYSLIRHPLYAGNLLFFAGSALWLGSTSACLATLIQLAATLFRIGVEEAHIKARLPAYADYARRVRGRLIPYVL